LISRSAAKDERIAKMIPDTFNAPMFESRSHRKFNQSEELQSKSQNPSSCKETLRAKDLFE